MTHPSRPVAIWLYTCAGAVFLMALIGAVTRLTESGLSIVEWQPIAGALPPLDDAGWQRAYDLYSQSPQGALVNKGMAMADFKRIFFWEWLHRLWGRLIGVVYALPLLFFWRRLPSETRPSFLVILGLGAAQGLLGWYMVKSGLVDQPHVSHYRLAAHLMLAAVIYAALVRQAVMFTAAPALLVSDRDGGRLRRFALIALGLVFATMTWGAFVAGLDAGLIYNTFPMMDAHWLPPEMIQHRPLWHSFVSEPATVQFTHRILAVLTFAKVIALWRLAQKLDVPQKVRTIAGYAALAVTAQAGLGIATLISHVDIHLATLHQGGAFVTLGMLTWLLYHLPPVARKDAA